MPPIHELLARVRHDRQFGKGRFEVGYFERREGSVRRVAFKDIRFPEGDRRVFELGDESGRVRRIPFHRVREVCRDAKIIWRRPARES
jgi:uncharacterized protein (UPF0248 family)